MFYHRRLNIVLIWLLSLCFIQRDLWGFPGGTVVKNPSTNAGDTRDGGVVPGWGRPPGGGSGNPLQCSCLENSTGSGGWQCVAWGHKESDTTEHTHTYTKRFANKEEWWVLFWSTFFYTFNAETTSKLWKRIPLKQEEFGKQRQNELSQRLWSFTGKVGNDNTVN